MAVCVLEKIRLARCCTGPPHSWEKDVFLVLNQSWEGGGERRGGDVEDEFGTITCTMYIMLHAS